MIAMTSDTAFLIIWVALTVVVLAWAAAAVLWAARNGQFRGQGRARYLALWSAIPREDGECRAEPGKAGKNVQP